MAQPSNRTANTFFVARDVFMTNPPDRARIGHRRLSMLAGAARASRRAPELSSLPLRAGRCCPLLVAPVFQALLEGAGRHRTTHVYRGRRCWRVMGGVKIRVGRAGIGGTRLAAAPA